MKEEKENYEEENLLPINTLTEEKFVRYFKDRIHRYILILIIIIALCGLLSFNLHHGAYYIVMIFFLAGIFVDFERNSRGVGIIFLFSHGGTGLLFMLGPTYSDVISNPVFTDSAGNGPILYFGLIALLLITAFVFSIIYNLSNKLKEIRSYKLIPLTLFTIVIVLTSILPMILPFLCKLKI